jgi:hypothetical protein
MIENFFYEDTFFSDLDDLLMELEIDQDNVNRLNDDFQIKVELSEELLPFEPDAELIAEKIADHFDFRIPDEQSYEDVKKAIIESIDIEKLKEKLPKFMYPNNVFMTITNADLIKHFE